MDKEKINRMAHNFLDSYNFLDKVFYTDVYAFLQELLTEVNKE
jgi:hypothetical protein